MRREAEAAGCACKPGTPGPPGAGRGRREPPLQSPGEAWPDAVTLASHFCPQTVKSRCHFTHTACSPSAATENQRTADGERPAPAPPLTAPRGKRRGLCPPGQLSSGTPYCHAGTGVGEGETGGVWTHALTFLVHKALFPKQPRGASGSKTTQVRCGRAPPRRHSDVAQHQPSPTPGRTVRTWVGFRDGVEGARALLNNLSGRPTPALRKPWSEPQDLGMAIKSACPILNGLAKPPEVPK